MMHQKDEERESGVGDITGCLAFTFCMSTLILVPLLFFYSAIIRPIVDC